MLDKTQVDEVGQFLLNAADYIEKNGWLQRKYVNDDGKVCLIGSLNVSISCSSFDKNFNSAVMRLYDYLHIDDLIEWNDKPGRTKEEVVEALRMAAYHL